MLKTQLIHCKIAHELDCDSGHLPISVQFDWEWKEATKRQTRNWGATDVNKLRSTLKSGIDQLQQLNINITTPQGLDDLTAQLVHTILKAIDTSTPWNNPSPRSIPGFDRECKQACTETQQLRRQWQASRLEEDWQDYKKARNSKGRLISKHLRQAHRERVTDAASSPKRAVEDYQVGRTQTRDSDSNSHPIPHKARWLSGNHTGGKGRIT